MADHGLEPCAGSRSRQITSSVPGETKNAPGSPGRSFHLGSGQSPLCRTGLPRRLRDALLIFPNPLNPAKYVVLNSGPPFREVALLNHSQQIPKLPDWAIIDVNTAPDGKWPGKVIGTGFFDERRGVGK